MKKVFFFIIEVKGWWAASGARQMGPYETSQLALAAVVKAITTFPDPDLAMDVVGRDSDGKTKILWRQNDPGFSQVAGTAALERPPF